MDFNQTLNLIEAEKKEKEVKDTFVKIIGFRDSEGRDLYKFYPWFHSYFPDKDNITGVVWGRAGSDIFQMDKIAVQFCTLKNGKIDKISGQRNFFTKDQYKKI